MKTWFRFSLALAAALCAASAGRAQALSVTTLTASPSPAKPGDAVTFTVGVSNAGAQFDATNTANFAVTLTNIVTGYSFTVSRAGVAPNAFIAAATPGNATSPATPSTGTFDVTVTIPTQTTEAGDYRGTVSISNPSAGTIGSSSFSLSKAILSINGKPDLRITSVTYQAGISYKGGDVIPMTLTYTNQIASAGQANVPFVPNGTVPSFRIELVLSANPTFGDADDFLLTFHDIGSKLNADGVTRTITWNQLLPGNFAGSYYVLAKIDALNVVDESVETDLTQNGNNIWYDVSASRLALQPTTFPTVYLASRTAGGASGNNYSDNPSVTADGRYTAFVSDSTNLGVGDTNNVRDVFLFDNQTSTTRRLSLSQQGAQANGPSSNPSISSDGRFVAFASDATNLVLGDTNGFADIFVVDTITGAITRDSVATGGGQANGSCFRPALSADGRFLVFESSANNLSNSATSGVSQIYLRDRTLGTTILVSQSSAGTAGNGVSLQAAISASGRYVAFASDAANLVTGDTNGVRDVFLRDTVAGTTIRVSVDSGGAQANGASRAPSINRNASATFDGRFIAFGSEASNLVAGDTNGVSDVFVFDRVTAVTSRVSVSSAGAQAVDPTDMTSTGSQVGSINPSISASGRYVAFASLANNLTPGDAAGQYSATDPNNALDIFVIDRDVTATGAYDTPGNIATSMVSVNRFGYQTLRILGSPSTAASDIYPIISGDGRWVAFPSDAEGASGLVHGATNRTSPDANANRDVFLFDRRINALPNPGSPPTVAVTSPGTGTSYPVNSAVTLVASASSPVGNVATVQFFVNGTSLGIATVFPYTAVWTPTATGTFALSALVTDTFGNQAVSNNINVVINPVSPVPPVVAITSPATGASLPVNVAAGIAATASDSDGTIASVQFLANGISVGTSTTFPYTGSFTPTSNGIYVLTAVATDNGGNRTTSAAVNVTVGVGAAPTASVTSPVNGAASVTGLPVNLTAFAADADGSVISVQFFVNGAPVGLAVTSAPYGVTWTPAASGSYSIVARAIDNSGNVTDSLPVNLTVLTNLPPVVAITSASIGSSVRIGAVTNLVASASDPDGTVASVQFFANGTAIAPAGTSAPYSTTWAPKSEGIYRLTAVAIDNAGGVTTSSVVTITVLANLPPVVAITSPSIGSFVRVGAAANLTASASDPDGTIASVQFFANGAPVGLVATSAPYGVTWTPAASGNYSIVARAIDNSGNVTDSLPVNLTVLTNLPPVVAITSASIGSSVRIGAVTNLVASASDPDGTVASVQFFANGTAIAPAGTSAPYSTTWAPKSEGIYRLTAVAIDNSGGVTTSSVVTITVLANLPPVVAIISANIGSIVHVGAATNLTASASDPDGTITSVQFFANGAPVGTAATSAPYRVTWTPAASGSYSIVARAINNSGNVTDSVPVSLTVLPNLLPVVAITSPGIGSIMRVGAAANLAASATDPDGTIMSVQFFANGTAVGPALTSAPYSTRWSPTAEGSFSLSAVAIDNAGGVTTSSVVTVTVLPNLLPVVAITSPSIGSSVRIGVATNLTASASDPDGTIASVQFFANGTAIGPADTSAPYSTAWSPTAEGIFNLTAVAIDDSGGVTTSAAITVVTSTVGIVGDTVYTGNYQGVGESGRFAMVNVRGKAAAFIGFSTGGAAKYYNFPALTLESGGTFAVTNSAGASMISGAATETGASGTLDTGRLTFIGTATFPAGVATVAAGAYSGNLTGKPASTLTAIVGVDGSITIYAADGAGFVDAGAGSVSSTGAFTITTASGNRFTGKADPATGFLTGTLTGGPGGGFMGAVASGASFSDGFLRNLSTRGQVGTGANVLIAGFVIGGNSPKQVLIRAIGPTLAAFGVTGVLADPQLQLFSGSTVIASNDNWNTPVGGNAASAASITTASGKVGAFPLAAGGLDAVVLATLPPGTYSVQVNGASGGAGVALVELYDVDSLTPFSPQKVMNVSTRGVVGTGQAQLIAGFVVSGNTPKKVLIRAVGPTLGSVFNVPGVLADPVLRLVRSDNVVVRENDNWESGNDRALVADASSRVGAFSLVAGSKDSVILINLPPGIYSAQVTGSGTTTGVAIVEVYEVP